MGRVHFGLDIASIVEQDIEYIVAFMLVGANDFRIDRDIVGQECVGDNPFFQAEVFRRMAGIDRINGGLKFLTITTGVNHLIEVVISKDSQGRKRIAYPMIGLFEGFEPDKIIGHRGEGLIADIRIFSHPAEPHIAGPGDQTGGHSVIVSVLLGIAS